MKKYPQYSTLDNLIDKTLSNLDLISDSRTVFGEQITTSDGTTVIPVSKASIGFVVGGGEYADLSTRRVGDHYPMAGASGGGVTLTPIGFLVDTDKEIKFIATAESNYQKIIENISNLTEFILDKFKKEKKKDDEEQK